MADGDDEKRELPRGNTDHEPKPEEARRRNSLPRGIAQTPSPSFTPGGPGMSGGYRAPRPPGPPRKPSPNDILMGSSRGQSLDGVPTVPKQDPLAPSPVLRRARDFDLPDNMAPEQRRAIEDRVKTKLDEIQQQRKPGHKL